MCYDMYINANLVYICYLIEVMRCFISISKNVTNEHLSILQKLLISYSVIIIITHAMLKGFDPIAEIIVVIITAGMLGTCFAYLFYLVFWYMKDSNLGPQAMILLRDQLKSAKMQFGLFTMTWVVTPASMICSYVWDDQNLVLLVFSILYFAAGTSLYSMSLLVGYAVQITQVSIKSRKKLLT
jgi:hypothetical protein